MAISSFQSQNDQELAYYRAQQFQFTPLSLLYLNLIHMDAFDIRLRRGEFTGGNHRATVRGLIEQGLITYDGEHCLTPRGSAHIAMLLEQKVKP